MLASQERYNRTSAVAIWIGKIAYPLIKEERCRGNALLFIKDCNTFRILLGGGSLQALRSRLS